VSQRLGQRRAVEHLDVVVVGVDVEHAGQHPLAGGIDHLRATRSNTVFARALILVEWVGGDRHHVAIANAEVANRRRGAGAVEPAAVADDRVVGHSVMEQGAADGVNEIVNTF
jgi:hypothetical protein